MESPVQGQVPTSDGISKAEPLGRTSRKEDPELEFQAQKPHRGPYSVFTKKQKQWISFVASFAAMFSTLSSYIYLPALVAVARDLNVSVLLINLTVTSYLIVAAVAPAFMGDLADQSGRKPIYILMFLVMLGANVGIALQTSFAALLVLKMLQSAGASGRYLVRKHTVDMILNWHEYCRQIGLTSLTYGFIADITMARERGGFVGVLLAL